MLFNFLSVLKHIPLCKANNTCFHRVLNQKKEPMAGVEPATSSLPRKRSTPELHWQKSGRRDSNPRPSAWKANALSTELLPQIHHFYVDTLAKLTIS